MKEALSREWTHRAWKSRLQKAASLRVGVQRGGIDFSPGGGPGQKAGDGSRLTLRADPVKLQAESGQVAVRGDQLLVEGQGNHLILPEG